jgi:hypothetical protein
VDKVEQFQHVPILREDLRKFRKSMGLKSRLLLQISPTRRLRQQRLRATIAA